MGLRIRSYYSFDLPILIRIWNEVVEDGMAFPQTEPLTMETGRAFFAEQSATLVAEEGGKIKGMYILHPNNVGRCGHIGNCSYAVARGFRGQGIGEKLVRHSISMASLKGFRLLQFNAVVASNTTAIHIYTKLGFKVLGHLPEGFRDKSGIYQDTVLFYYDLMA